MEEQEFYHCEECSLNSESEGQNVIYFSDKYEIEDENIEKIPSTQKKIEFRPDIPIVRPDKEPINLIATGNCEYCNHEHFMCNCGEVFAIKESEDYIEHCECGKKYHILPEHEGKGVFNTRIAIAKENIN